MISLDSPSVNKRNPFIVYQTLRDSPICRVNPGRVWALTRYTDVQFALQRSDLFSSAGIKSFITPDWLADDCKHDLFIVTEDGKEHAKHRSLVNKAFVQRVIQALIPLMKNTAQQLFDEVDWKKPVDFVEAFSYPYIGKIIGHITGVGNGLDIADVRRWIQLTEGLMPTRPSAADYIDDLQTAMRRQINYFQTVIKNRRANPRSDLVTELINAEIDGERLTDDLLNNALDMLIRAGYMTTIYLLSSCVALLGQMELPGFPARPMVVLRESPELIPLFIEEVLRWQSPILCTVRSAVKDVTLHDITIPKTDLALIILGAANRDSAIFANADQFDIYRPNNKEHLSFGYGPHVCVGMALARLEVKIALEMLVAHFTDIRCPSFDELEWTDSYMIRGLAKLPVELL